MALLIDGVRQIAPAREEEPPPAPVNRRPDGGPATDDGVDPPPPPDSGRWYGDSKAGPDEMGVASYNLAGGADNDHRNKYGQTHAAAADEIVNGGSDVVAFQEVQVGRMAGQDEGENPKDVGQDYNEQVLVHTYLQTVMPSLDPSAARRPGAPEQNRYENIEVKSVRPDGQVVDYDPTMAKMQYTFTGMDGKKQTVEVNRTSLDASGLPTGSYDPNAQNIRYSASKDGVAMGQDMTIRRESLDENGVAVRDGAGKPVYQPGGDNLPGTPVTVYSAKIDAGVPPSHPAYPHHQPTLDYTMVFGKTLGPQDMRGGGVYGNSVLLGPKNQIARDENGAIRPGQIDNEPMNEGGGVEKRGALGIKLQHEGRDVTFVGTHLSAGDNPEERGNEMRRLGAFANDFGGGKVVVAGDLNGKPGENYEWGGWKPGGKRYPSDEEIGLELTDKSGGNGIDHILIGDDLDAKKTTTSGSWLNPVGGSDHDLIQNTIILP